MKKNNWLVLAIAGVLFMSGLLITAGQAIAAYPDRPVTILVGFAPGGSMSMSARAIAKSVEKILGQPVIVENKAGGTGTVALASMLSQNPDGYTLCATPSSVLIRVSQMQQVPFTPFTDCRFPDAAPPELSSCHDKQPFFYWF